jgi:hypothetical protein
MRRCLPLWTGRRCLDGVGIINAAAATLDGKSYVHLVMHAWAHPGEDSQRWGRISEVCREKAPRPFSVCRSPAVTGRRRCRMHGGAQGSGGPKGARNGNYKHGRYTAEMIATRRWLRETTREVRALTRTLRDQR